MNLLSRVVCIIITLSSLLLILAMGSTNVKNFEKVQSSIQEIYKDRLFVKGLIFELSTLLHSKEIAVVTNNKNFYLVKNDTINKKIENNLKSFRKTYLTPKEEKTLNLFSNDIQNLTSVEKKIMTSNKDRLPKADSTKLITILNRLQMNLITLSDIQLAEGKHKMQVSYTAVAKMQRFETLERYAIIILAILLFAFIFIPKSLKYPIREKAEVENKNV